jgi:membrane-associated phospholipid phosphatase
VRTFASDFLRDEYHIWTGPFQAHNYDSHTMKKYGLPFLLISAGLIASDRQTAKWLRNTTGQVIWSGRVSQIGAPYTLAGFAGVYYGIGRATGNEHARETGFLALEALAESQFVAIVLKEVTQRQRPVANNIQRDGFWKGGNSFPSGHAMGSFAVATVFAYEYRDHIAVPITAYSLATIVDLSRFGARAHWYSDVFVGSAMGFLIGRHAYKIHHDPDLPGSPVPRPISRLRPTFRAGDQGVGLYWDL